MTPILPLDVHPYAHQLDTMKPLALSAPALLTPVLSQTIPQINGNHFLSSYNGESADIEGVITALSSNGVYLRSTTPDTDPRISNSIRVYNDSAVDASVGDLISVSGKVSEYRSSPDYIYLTELRASGSDFAVQSSDNDVAPIALGKDARNPPTEQFSSLDNGAVFGLPANTSQVSNENPELQPEAFGLDFWESLSAELVTVSRPRAVGKPNQYGDTWIVGDWGLNGSANARGGLTMREKDANPEAILVGSPLDGSSNPTDTKVGDYLGENITGVITQAYGFYALLPTTALDVSESNSTAAPATGLSSDGTCAGITVGDYNVNNLSPNSTTLSQIAGNIASDLKGPNIVFLQEIQDNSGPTDDGVVSANETLSALASEIKSQDGPDYSFIDIDPVNDRNGGQPGGNIRVAYLYDTSVVQLHNPNPGTSKDAIKVNSDGELNYNPGLIDPENEAWESSRKPLVAEWETADGKNTFFTINVHLTSKGGSSSLEGDARPPVNGGVEKRTAQAKVIANFTNELLSITPTAKILASGDFNEFSFAEPLTVFASESGLLDLDDVVNIPATERYTYVYEQNCQELDHVYVSKGVVEGKEESTRMEHVHVNTWVSYDDQGSDHDPSVALVDVCS